MALQLLGQVQIGPSTINCINFVPQLSKSSQFHHWASSSLKFLARLLDLTNKCTLHNFFHQHHYQIIPLRFSERGAQGWNWLDFFFFFFNDVEPHQDMALWTHPQWVNHGCTTPPPTIWFWNLRDDIYTTNSWGTKWVI